MRPQTTDQTNGFIIKTFAIFMTMLSICLGASLFFTSQDLTFNRIKTTTAVADLHNAENTIKKLLQREQQLKDAIDYPYEDIGDFNVVDKTTVLGSLRADLDELRLTPYPENIRQAIIYFQSVQDQHFKKLSVLEKENKHLNKLIASLDERWQAVLTVEKNKRREAEKERADILSKQDELMDGKLRQITELTKQSQDIQKELAALKENYALDKKTWADRERILTSSINRLRKHVSQLKGDLKVDTEPDALVTRIEPITKTLWINRGEKDKLRKGIVFSVSASKGPDAGRVKGRVKVIKILNNNMAEAKIISDKLTSPIVSGDVLSSSIWTPGQTQEFAIAGIIDLDGDGKTDIDQVKTFIEKSGGKSSHGQTTKETRPGSKSIDENTSGLVVGKLPDPTLLGPSKKPVAMKFCSIVPH